MSTWKKWMLGVALILSALSGAVVAVLDNDESTQVNATATVDAIKEGVNVIRAEGAE